MAPAYVMKVGLERGVSFVMGGLGEYLDIGQASDRCRQGVRMTPYYLV